METATLHTTPYGRPAALLLRARISAAKADDPLQPVTVVVPTNYVGVSIRRLLAGGAPGGDGAGGDGAGRDWLGPVTARGAGIAGLHLSTVYRLAELLGAPRLAAAGRRPVSTPVIAAAVRQVLREEPGIFGPVREHPSTEEALVRSYRELSELRAETLDTLAAGGARASEVVRLRRAVRARLEATWFEEADLMASAEQAVVAHSTVLGDLGTVVVYLPQDLSPPAAALLRALAARTPVEVIAARTGAPDADADVDRSLGRLGLKPPARCEVVPPAATAVVCVSDAEEEARSAVERIVAAARRGVPLERMAVLYPSPEPYARIVAEQLGAAGIPYNGRGVRPLADRMLGRWLLDLLGLADRDFSRPAVMGLIAGAPVVGPDGRRVPAGPWERVSREAGVVRGRADWDRRLRHHAVELRSRADRETGEPEPRDWLVDRHRRSADLADELRAFAAGLFDQLDDGARCGSWRGLVEWCTAMARRLLGDDRRRERWPEVERAAADRVEEALDRLAGLDEVEAATDLSVFRRTLELQLGDDLGRVGEFGHGVLVGRTSAALGVDLDLVVVLGLAEGVCPTRPREDSLLPDAERRAVADELRLRGDDVGVEHRHLLAALAASTGERVLTYPRGDLRRSVDRAPSRWLLDAAGALGGGGPGDRRLPDRADWLEFVPSFARRMSTVAFPATPRQYGLRALALHRGPLTGHPLVAGDEGLRRGVELALTRGRDGFTRFDGNLGGVADRVPAPTDPERVLSASQLELWLSCPHAYLMQYVLRVQPVENPEELLEIDPMEKGSLVHEVLERWLGEQLTGPLPPPERPWPAAARVRILAIAAEVCAAAEARGVTGHPLLWGRDRNRILADVARFVDHDDDRRARLGLTPAGAEQPFGMDGAPPVALDLRDGRAVQVRGRIDRLDRAADGSLVVADYKTGGTNRYRQLSEEKPLGDGTKLQLALYGLVMQALHPAAGGVRAEYWFTSTKGAFARIGYPVTDGVAAALRRALRVAADGITAGHFPMKPPEPGWRPSTECRFCDTDDLGTSDRYRDWERIRTAGALRGYVAYLNPDASTPAGAA
ncbi:PD-(D/E)XK nuclease family protein [soil metagenome]